MSNRNDPKGDVRHSKDSARNQADVTRTHQAGLLATLEEPISSPERTLNLLAHFANFDHGYLKWKRDSGGSTLHLTWTWTLGKHAGSYVYAAVEYWRFGYGLEVLAHKLFSVDEGLLMPTVDKRRTGQA